MDYSKFIDQKIKTPQETGIDIELEDINPKLYNFQKAIVKWGLKRGKAALFEDCGLGKACQALEWGNQVSKKTNEKILLLAPLAVSSQFIREAEKFNVDGVGISRNGELNHKINVTNYERLHYFSPDDFSGIILDESAILKGFAGKVRRGIDAFAKRIKYRLACTATPSPNDLMEIGTHSDFLSVMPRSEMLSTYFVHDSGQTSKWRLKGHAASEFWKWMASWCVALRSPRDLGYTDVDFDLPPLNFHNHIVKSKPMEGLLFVEYAKTLNERRKARRDSLEERVSLAAEIANSKSDQVLVWCDLNAESAALKKAIPDSIEVKGSDSIEHKEDALLGFTDKKYRVLISKPSISGHGLNWQQCNQMIFTGLSDSYEQMYQSVRRCWRYGQTNPVDCHIVTSEAEGEVLKNIKRKEAQAKLMFDSLIEEMKIHELNIEQYRNDEYFADCEMKLPKFLTGGF
jgi:hypothetical protein